MAKLTLEKQYRPVLQREVLYLFLDTDLVKTYELNQIEQAKNDFEDLAKRTDYKPEIILQREI